MTKKNNLYINIKDGDTNLAILSDFLREGEISSRSLVALSAFYLSLAIAKSPNSTQEDIRKAEHYCLSQLKQQMCYIMDKHYRDDGIDMNANEFSTVTINQSVPSNLGSLPLVQPTNIDRQLPVAVTQQLSLENQDRAIAANTETEKFTLNYDRPAEELDDDDDDDDDDDLTDEEYGAKMLARIPDGIIRIKS